MLLIPVEDNSHLDSLLPCVRQILASLVGLRAVEGVLCRVNSHVFQVFKSWEHVIRANEHRIHESRIKDKFITMCKDASIELQSQVPTFSCHPILDRLLKKYITLRIYITCRKISRSDNVIPMSSKSTAMRHMVGNIR